MDTTVLLTSLLAAAAVVMVTYGLWSVVTAERSRVAMRVSRTGIGVGRSEVAATDVRVQDRTRALFAPVDRALAKYSWAERARMQLEKAEINLRLSEFVVLRLALTAAALLVPTFIAINSDRPIFILLGIGLAAFMWWQCGGFVRRRISRRQRSLEAHLDEALVNIAGSLRAGFSFTQACQLSLNQLPWPLKQELQEMLEEINVGASLDDALRHLAERVESYEVDIAVNAVLVQRQVGGSLAEILENVARTIRERRELRGQILTLTAQQRLSSYFVAGVPVFMAVVLTLTNWEFMRPLYVTLVGNILLTIGIVFNVLGFLVMRRLTRIDF